MQGFKGSSEKHSNMFAVSLTPFPRNAGLNPFGTKIEPKSSPKDEGFLPEWDNKPKREGLPLVNRGLLR